MLWLMLLGIAAWLALFGDKSPDGQAKPVQSRTSATAGAAPSRPKATTLAITAEPLVLPVDRQLLAARQPANPQLARPVRDLFSARSWAPPSVAALPAPAPVAPAVPFAFIGKKLESGAWEVYLGRAEQSFVAREGDVLEGSWRVDRIDPPALTLTYLPLAQSQTLAIGDIR